MSAALAPVGRTSIATELKATADDKRRLVVAIVSISVVTAPHRHGEVLDNRKLAENQFSAL
jgi:hypothetical protein